MRESNERASRGKGGIAYSSRENMKEYRGGNQEGLMSAGKLGRYNAERRERLALRNKVNSKKHLEMYGGLSIGLGMKTYLHGPKDSGENAETAISCRGPGPARKKKEVYTSSRVEEGVDAQQMCPCGEARE